MKNILFLVLYVVGVSASAQHIEGEIELAGFLLGQYRTAVHGQLGAPIERRVTDEKWLYEFHKITPDTSVYALFKYPAWDSTRVYAIQVSGRNYPEMRPFRGLKLGAKVDDVVKVFGTSHDTETIADPPVTVHYYEHKNYSFEINKAGYLTGIQIYGSILTNKAKDKMASIRGFRDAIIHKNIDSLLNYLSPDVEIMHAHNEIGFSGAARDEFSKSGSRFIELLLGDSNSVFYAFDKERAEGHGELKSFGEGNEIFTVFKFFDSAIISEILFYPHAGRWKVFEIRFRK